MRIKPTWRDIVGWEGYYEINSVGEIRSKDRLINGRLYKSVTLRYKYIRGYVNVGLSRGGRVKTLQVHRLVMKTFRPVPNQDNLQVNHINGKKDDNRLGNLEWVTASENIKHSYRLGLQKSQVGSDNNYSKLKDEDVLDIRYKYKHLSETETAKIFNVSRSLIGVIRRREVWKHVK